MWRIVGGVVTCWDEMWLTKLEIGIGRGQERMISSDTPLIPRRLVRIESLTFVDQILLLNPSRIGFSRRPDVRHMGR